MKIENEFIRSKNFGGWYRIKEIYLIPSNRKVDAIYYIGDGEVYKEAILYSAKIEVIEYSNEKINLNDFTEDQLEEFWSRIEYVFLGNDLINRDYFIMPEESSEFLGFQIDGEPNYKEEIEEIKNKETECKT